MFLPWSYALCVYILLPFDFNIYPVTASICDVYRLYRVNDHNTLVDC